MFKLKPLQASLLITSVMMFGVVAKHPFVDFSVCSTSDINVFTKHSNIFLDTLEC